jgi:rhamnogalacturonyl hydrolase YesR
MKTALTTLGISLFVLAGCTGQKQSANDFIQENIDNAVAQETLQTDIIEKSGEILNPRTIDEEGNIHYIPIDDWCSGFFPGNIWYTYELTGDKKWLPLAEKYTEALDSVQYLTWHHDVGFMIGSSYLNGYRFANKEEYKPVIIQTARSLSTRFRPNPGVIQSWDADKGWQAKRGWKCPVIIDNMMNLELMFEATRLSGDSTFYDIARKHADTTMANHFRADNSCYHVVDYDPETGEVRKKQTAQGYADESAWARGQAWALYGYTMCYRYTHDVKYLEQAEKIYGFIFNKDADTMQCPAGHLAIKYRIDKRSNQKKNTRIKYFFDINKCHVCPYRNGCYKENAKTKTYSITIKSDYHKNQEAFQNPLYDRGKK